MASVFTVLTKLQADVSNFSAGMSKAQASLDKLEQAVAKTGGAMDKNLTKETGKASGGLGKLKGAFLAAGAAGAAFAGINYVKGAIGAASAFEAEFVGVEQTFGSASQVVKDFAANAAATAGLSETAALRYSKSFGGFATAAGLAGEAQAQFSTSLVQTAGDLGSFFDMPTEDALTAISMGLRGEYEGLRRFNILIDDNVLKQVAMAEGISDGSGELTQQQKVLARQAAILDQVGVAQNDFTNYADTYGNSIKTVGALMENLSADVGAALLPSMAALAQAIIPVVEQLGPVLGRVIEALIPTIEALTESVEPLIGAIEPLFEALEPILNVFSAMVEKLLPPLIDAISILGENFSKLMTAAEPLLLTLVDGLAWALENIVIPAMAGISDVIANVIIPAIEFLNPILLGLVEVFNTYVLPVIKELVGWVEKNLPGIQKVFEDVFAAVGDAVTWVWNNILKPVFGGLADFLGIDMTVFENLGATFMKGFNKGIDKGGTYNGNLPWYVTGDPNPNVVSSITTTGETIGAAINKGVAAGLKKDAEKVTSAWEELFQGFSKDVAQQEAKLKLTGMGLSEGLITKILGDADWESIYDRIIKGGEKTAKNLQNSFNKTTEGIEEMTAAFKEFTETAEEFNRETKAMLDGFKILPTIEDNFGRFEQQIADFADSAEGRLSDALSLKLITEEQKTSLLQLVATHETAMRDIAKQRDALDKQLADVLAVQEYGKQFKESAQQILASVQPLQYASEEIGAFENSVITAFSSVADSINMAVKAGYLSDELSKSMKNLAAATAQQLRVIASQRDKLASEYQGFVEQLNSAKEFRKATREAAIGYSNITSLGTSARTIIKNFGVMVKRTEKFRDDLSTLNQMGLNKELYNQILESGLDAGSATAKALLKGGPKAVEELNSMFDKLQTAADQMADETTKVMFDGGESTIQGFMNGVMEQDEALRLQAEQVANAFASTFQFNLDLADTNIDALIASLKSQQSALETTATSLAQAFNAAFSSAVSVAIAQNAPTITPKPDNSAAIAALDLKIANAQRYIKNVNNDKMEAGALVKLEGYIAQRAELMNAATGGYIRGGGTGTSDSIPAMLSNGEFVMRAAAVEKFGAGFMSAINSGRVPSFATGGSVGRSRIVSGGGGKTTVNNKFEINVRTGIGDPAAIGKQVVSAIAAYEKTSGRRIIG